MTFSEKLSVLRKKAGLSQEQLAELLDVSRQSVSKWEAQQTMPEIEKIIAISDIFNISLDVLLRNDREIDNSPQATAAEGITQSDSSRTRLSGRIRANKYSACVLGVFAFLLVAVLFLGTLALRPGNPVLPSASADNSTQLDYATSQDADHQPNKEHLQNYMKFKRYMRGALKHVNIFS